MKPGSIKAPKDLSGGQGLLLSLINLAIRDALDPDGDPADMASAFSYLSGPYYQYHLKCLDLPPATRPMAIEKMSIDQRLKITGRMLDIGANCYETQE
jgi:hypothetical protein